MRNLSKTKQFRYANCSVSKPTEQSVQNDLSLTPRKVKELSMRGIPVNLSNVSVVKDPDSLSGVVPIQSRRFMDLNTAWETSVTTKQALIKQFKNR